MLLSDSFNGFIRNAQVFHCFYKQAIICPRLILRIQRFRYFPVALGFTFGYALGSTLGYKSIKVSYETHFNTYFGIYWGFDEDGKLIDVLVTKDLDMIQLASARRAVD